MKTCDAIVICASILTCASGVFGQTVENPQYRFWSSYKPGSWSTAKASISRPGGSVITTQTTTTLVKVEADKLIIATKVTLFKENQSTELPPQTIEISSHIENSEELPSLPFLPAGLKLTGKDPKTSSGELLIGDKKISVSIKDVILLSGDPKVSFRLKTWSSKTVPGGIVKMELQGVDNEKTSYTSQVSEFHVAE